MLKFEFDGELRTVREVHALVPFMTQKTVRKYLHAGLKTREQMTTVNPKAGRLAGGRRGAAKRHKWGET